MSVYHSCCFEDILTCDGTHKQIALIAWNILADKYVWTGKKLFFFNGAVWKEDEFALEIRHDLAFTVFQRFMEVLTRPCCCFIAARSINNNIVKNSNKLQNAKFRSQLVKKHLRELFYDPTFINILDAN
jgi:hypothetical protein